MLCSNSIMIARLTSGILGHSDFDFKQRQFLFCAISRPALRSTEPPVASEGFYPSSKGT
jgi:hypothetical protein